MRANLATTDTERDRYKGLYEGLSGGNAAAQDKANELTGKLDAEKQVSLRALAQVEVLNQQIAALRRQLGALEQALEVSEKKDKDSQSRLADLGQRLNVALAQRVQELSRYRSDFFGRLREILGNRPDIRVVGDRFVLQSEVFFDTGQSVLKPEGRAELDKIAAVLLDVTRQIPQDIAWVLRVDGHTDVRPIGGSRTNWDLSAARAIAVVQYLISKGMPPQRLVAAGFGEFQPIDPGHHRRGLQPQPPHRAEADGAVSAVRLSRSAPTSPPTKTRRSSCGSGPGRTPIRTSISPRASAGGASAGATSLCRRPRSSSPKWTACSKAS